MLIVDIWQLALQSSAMGGANINYDIVKDMSKRYNLDRLEVLRVCKIMTRVSA